MNIFLQIGIGLLPGCIVTIILLIARRAFNINKILLTLLLTGICGGALFFGASKYINENIAISPRLSQKKMMAFANALTKEGAYEEAGEVIDQYSSLYGYDDECRLLNARISLLKDDFEGAYHLYAYLCDESSLVSSDDEEVIFAQNRIKSSSSDLVMINYLKSVGEDIAEYGYSQEYYSELKNAAGADHGDIQRDIKSAIEDQYKISDDMSECAEAVAEVSALYIEALQNGEDVSTNHYRRVFNHIEDKSGELMSLECVNKARIKAYVIAGDYEAIAQKLNASSDYHELMIAAELYMSGLIEKSDFSDDYRQVNKIDALAVGNRLNKIYRNVHKGMNVQERNALKSRISAIEKQLDDPALMAIKQQLTAASETEAGNDKTKVCLELAKIENYFGNESSTDSYLSTAIYSSLDNEDDSYVAAMSKIINVISNDEDTEAIKNVTEYVDNVLDHSLTIDVEKIVSPQYNVKSQPGSDHEDTFDEDFNDNENEYDNENEKEQEDQDNPDFARTAVDYVSRIKSSITIGKIDTSAFEEITARVQIDTDRYADNNELKNALKIYDCGAQIRDFSLNKIQYSGSSIMLVCDVSGSMDGSIQDLRDAVVKFVTDKNADENLAVVTFDDSIVDTKMFGTPDDELISFAQNMYADGGTDMFSATVNCLEDFSPKDNANNVLILMTDGQDNTPRSEEDIYGQIGALALEKGVTVYTLGLGSDVDTFYLKTIAASGNGEFVYVSDSASLSSFYNMLHSQVYSQYEIKYRAEDTITMSGRTLEVALPDENMRDVKTYSLNGSDEENSLEVNQNLSISGLNPRYIYKGIQDRTVKLKGSGFKADSKITVKLNGHIDYTVNAKFADSETYTVEIPASVAVGMYDVEVSIDGKKKILHNGFSVIVQGNEKKTAFGPYVFTSAEKIENGEQDITLRGAVTMNGWLHFKGDLRLVGDLENGGSIMVSDYSGSYVSFDSSTAEGIGKFFAKKGIEPDFPVLYDFNLYNDQAHYYDYENYQVDDISTGLMTIYSLMHFDSPVLRLYPDSLGVYYKTGTTILPYQDQILKACGQDDLFSFSFDGSARITDKNIGIVMDMEYDDPSNSDYIHKINRLNSPVYFNGECNVKINTITNEYTLGAMVRLAFFAKQSGLGAEVSWKGELIPDSVKLRLELAQPVMLPTTIPIEVNDFSFMVSDINTAVENHAWTNLVFTGSATFSAGKVETYFPALANFLDDVSVFEMPDTTASVRVSPFKFEANAKLIFLSEIQLAEADVKLGNFEYSNTLLGLNNESVTGLSAGLKTGFMWDTADGRVSLDLSGTGRLDAHTRFVGVNYDATMKYDIKWWLINLEKTKQGDVALGLYTTHSGKPELVFTYRTQESNGKVNGKFYYIDFNGNCGSQNGVLS